MNRLGYGLLHILLCLILSCVLFSCAGDNRFSDWDKTFGAARPLSSTPLLSEELIMGHPYMMQYADSSLVIYDDIGDSLFILIDLADNNRIYRFGQKGQGADEFIQPYSLAKLPGDTLLGVYDCGRGSTFHAMNLRQLKRGIEHYPVLQKDTLGSLKLFQTRDGDYLGTGFYAENLLSLTTPKGERKYFFEYPYQDKWERGISNYLRGMAYQGDFCSNDSLNRFMYAVRNSPIFMLFLVHNGQVEKTYEFVGGYPVYKTEETEKFRSAPMDADNVRSFVASCATDGFIYLLYCGKTMREETDADIVYQLTWDGKPVNKFKLDFPVAKICVSKDDSMLYALANKGELEVVQYKLR